MYLDLISLVYLFNLVSGGLTNVWIIYISQLSISPVLASTMNMVLALALLNIYSNPNGDKKLFKNVMKGFSLLFLIQNIIFALYFLFNPHNCANTLITPLIFLVVEFMLMALILKSELKACT
ncbi:hypothetical protein [Methanobacterium subterraneum]|jgi:hypothetical protein|uniref:Uncharacterized protein n=1 Tax=Methanobacterium subterraneum TaxID=59277 RepID=A0A7K4DMN8_9EURY|nr:hypothetical protein [Methanobacterium subterraneum]MBW4256124.1 hypothetical protein [Methanobacterium sp. YSL]NMO09296.1 hypothetical protein [Methanobacterium subterraneum]